MAVATTSPLAVAKASPQPRMSWATVLHHLENTTTALSPKVAAFITSRVGDLVALENPSPKSKASYDKVTSGRVTLGGVQVDVSKEEQNVVTGAAERFDLDEVEALTVLRAIKGGKVERVTEEDMSQLMVYVFDERMSVMAVFTLLLRCRDDVSHPCHEFAKSTLSPILTPTFTTTLLRSFTKRTSRPIPTALDSMPQHSFAWVKQLVREQKAVLEIVFLVYYGSQRLPGRDLVEIIECINETQWGTRQETFGYFDAETTTLVQEIGDLLGIIAIEGLNLEFAMAEDDIVPSPTEKLLDTDHMYTPDNLLAINESIENLVHVDSPKAGPVLLGWAFVLSRISNSFTQHGIPDVYRNFARQTLGVTTDTTSQPLFQLYAAHALSPACNLFNSLLAIIRSPLFTSSPTSAVGYISVLRALVTCLPLIVRLTFLSPEQYTALIDVFAALYGLPSASILCAEFWEATLLDDADFANSAASVGEVEMVDLARSRFPVQFAPFVKIVRALSHPAKETLESDGTEEEDVAKRSAECAFSYISTLSTFTHILRAPTAIGTAPYEVVGDVDPTKVLYRATRPIPVSKSVTIPAGSWGTLVSQPGRKPTVIAWGMEWSGWKLFGDVLEDFANVDSPAADVFGGADEVVGLPMEWDSELEREEDVTAILDVFRTTLTSNPQLGTTLIEHMAPASTASQTEFIGVLFRILDRTLVSAAQRPVPTKLVSSLIGLIAALLPCYPGKVWTFLRGSSLLFPSSTTASIYSQDASREGVLNSEKVDGRYPITLSLLSLLFALVLEYQTSSYAIPEEFDILKQGVLVRALSWVRDDIWPNSSSWKYANLAEKHAIGNRMVQLYLLILEEGELSSAASEGKFDPVVSIVLNALLRNATTAQLSPLLSHVAAGPEAIFALRTSFRHTDAKVTEELVAASLTLVRKLLQLRRQIVGSPISLLERLCLSRTVEQGLTTSSAAPRTSILESLAKYAVATVSPETAIQAAKVFTLLAIGTGDWQPRPPSLIAVLGGSDKTAKFVSKLLEVVPDAQTTVGLEVVLWDLISSIVESQPSLAMLLVTGSQYPSGSDQEQEDGKSKDKPADAGALILKSSTAPAIFQPLPRAAITVAMESLESWSTMWEHSPSLLAAVLRFFDFVWQHLLDYGTALDEYRTQPTLWDVLIKVGFSNPLKVPHDHDGVVAYCHQTMAKAHAIRILALDTQATIVRSSSAVPLSAKTLLKSLANRPQLEKVLLDALATSCKPKLQTEIFTLIHQSFPEVPMEALRLPPPTHALDDSRQFGRGYLYSLPILGRKLDAFILDPTAMVGQESLVEVIDETAELNLNFSLLDAQVSHTRSWRQLFEIMLPVLRRDAAASAAVMAVATVVSQDIASEDRVAQTITTVHVERLAILLTMVELLEGMPSAQVKDTIGPLLHNVSLIFTNNALPPLDSVTRRATPLFHSPLLRIAFFLFRTLGNFEGASPAQTASLSASTDVIFRIMITATRDLLALARVSKDVEIEQDLSVAVAVVGQIVSSPFVPSPTTWLAHCHDVDLFRHAFEVFVDMEVIDGRPLYAGHILNLCLALASSTPRAAEQMALDGLMTALTNNALTAAAEAGTIDVLTMDGERTPQHEIWTSMLALVVAIVSALGESTQFVEQEVMGFARLYAAQIAVSMSWRAEGPLTLAGLEETKNAAALMYGLVHRTSGNSNVAAAYVDQGLRLLQQVVYAILHPNRLLALVEGVTPEERVWIETDTGGDTADLALRPVVGTITMSLIKLAQVIVDSLLAYTMAFDVLTRESSEWRMDRAIVIPSATVTLDEKASVGTLFDLASFCLDTLRQPISPPLVVSPTTSAFVAPLPAYSAEDMSTTSRHTLEGILLLASTQLVLWLYKPDPTPSRSSTAMRREITGELVVDLVSTLDRTANLGKVVERTKKRGAADPGSPKKGAGGPSGRLLEVLKEFLNDNVVEGER